MTSTTDLSGPAQEQLQCMEVWGGHGRTENHFTRPGLDVWIWSNTQDTIESGGGDLHMLSSCASGRITRMLLADICGYGSIFTQIASELRELMKRNVNTIQQARLVRQMTDRLEQASQRGGYASTLISTYFAPTRSLTMCNAGHPPPLLYRHATREWTILKQVPNEAFTPDVNFGVMDPVEYQQVKTKLEVGDLLLSYSNVLTECHDSNGRTLGLHGLLQLVKSLDAQDPDEFGRKLLRQIRIEDSENLTDSDATVLLCRATTTRPSLKDNMLAPLRMLRQPTSRES